MSQTEGKLVQSANCTKIFFPNPFKSTLNEKILGISSLEQDLSHWVGPIPIPKKIILFWSDFELFLISVDQNMLYRFRSSNLYYSMKTVLILKPESISLLKRFLFIYNENYILSVLKSESSKCPNSPQSLLMHAPWNCPLGTTSKRPDLLPNFSQFVAKFPANIAQFVAEFLTKYARWLST